MTVPDRWESITLNLCAVATLWTYISCRQPINVRKSKPKKKVAAEWNSKPHNKWYMYVSIYNPIKIKILVKYAEMFISLLNKRINTFRQNVLKKSCECLCLYITKSFLEEVQQLPMIAPSVTLQPELIWEENVMLDLA